MLRRLGQTGVLSSKDFCRSQALKNGERPMAVICSESKGWSVWHGRAWQAQCPQGFCTQKELGLEYNKITISLYRKIKPLPTKYKNPMAVLYYKLMTHPGTHVYS